MPNVEVTWRVFRPETVETARGPVALTGRSRAVILALLLESNRVVTVDQLIAFLWADEAPRTARNSIARFVADLRAALGALAPRIATVGSRLHGRGTCG